MKKLITISLALLALASCGRKKTYVVSYDDKALKSELESKLANMQAMIDASNNDIDELQSDIVEIKSRLLELEENVSILEVIDPCGDAPNVIDEVIFKVIHMGEVKHFASFSDNKSGLNTRFALLGAGTYQTTDGSNCVFTIE